MASKNFRVETKRLNPTEDSLLAFLLDHPHWNLIDEPRITDRYLEALADVKRLGPQIVDGRQHVLYTTDKSCLGTSLWAGRIVWVTFCPVHLAVPVDCLADARAFSLLVYSFRSEERRVGKEIVVC